MIIISYNELKMHLLHNLKVLSDAFQVYSHFELLKNVSAFS